MLRDIENAVGAVNLLDPQDLAHTDTASALLDTSGFEGAGIVVHVGALTGVDSSNYLTPVLQESDSTLGTSFTAVASGDIEGGFTKIDSTSEDSVVQFAGYKGRKRYIRVNLDYTGTGITAGVVGVVGLVQSPHSAPVSAPAAVAST